LLHVMISLKCNDANIFLLPSMMHKKRRIKKCAPYTGIINSNLGMILFAF
jgi:hypothetical protein